MPHETIGYATPEFEFVFRIESFSFDDPDRELLRGYWARCWQVIRDVMARVISNASTEAETSTDFV
jgi:hypothetical protein